MQLKEEPVENQRPLKVAVIGAGWSGIYLGIRIPERLRNVELTIFERNKDIGGTWWENRYPGCACDIPSHSYQYSFCPNPSWSRIYAPAKEILAYIQSVANRYSVPRFVKLQHEINDCRWIEEDGQWVIKGINHNDGTTFEQRAHVLVAARGILNGKAWPDLEGLDSFKGKLVHSADWDEAYDFSNQRIGVIGSGSSAIQIVPSMQSLPGTHVSTFVRNPTWISNTFGDATMAKLGLESTTFSEEQIREFEADPAKYHRYRKQFESDGNAVHGVTEEGTEMSKGFKKRMTEIMRQRLSKKPEIADFMIPEFSPGCRRLTPGPGYLEALQEDNVDFITTHLKKIHPHGVELEDGRMIELDTLACATGFNVSAPPPFPIIGRDGKTVKERFTPIPESYMTLTVDGFPNYFTMLGPNSGIGSGSLTIMMESMGDYIVKCIRKIQKEEIHSMEIKNERVRDFQAYKDQYFKRTVYAGNCRSWYKSNRGDGDVIIGLWPGSTLHMIEAIRSPRWEDYVYTYNPNNGDGEGEPNALRFLGNGWSKLQTDGGDLSWYIEPEHQDIPSEPLPEECSLYEVRPFSH